VGLAHAHPMHTPGTSQTGVLPLNAISQPVRARRRARLELERVGKAVHMHTLRVSIRLVAIAKPGFLVKLDVEIDPGQDDVLRLAAILAIEDIRGRTGLPGQ
jgi:hypothetical protein